MHLMADCNRSEGNRERVVSRSSWVGLRVVDDSDGRMYSVQQMESLIDALSGR